MGAGGGGRTCEDTGSLTAHFGPGAGGARVRIRVSRVARRDVRCGNARCLVVARQDLCGGKKQGRRPSAASTKGGHPLCGSLVSCHKRHLVLPQRTSRLATRETRILTRAPRAPRPKCAVRDPVSSHVRPPRPRPKCAIRDFSRRQSVSQKLMWLENRIQNLFDFLP